MLILIKFVNICRNLWGSHKSPSERNLTF